MRAVDVMVRDVVTVRPDTDVADATKLLARTMSAPFRFSTKMAIWSVCSARPT